VAGAGRPTKGATSAAAQCSDTFGRETADAIGHCHSILPRDEQGSIVMRAGAHRLRRRDAGAVAARRAHQAYRGLTEAGSYLRSYLKMRPFFQRVTPLCSISRVSRWPAYSIGGTRTWVQLRFSFSRGQLLKDRSYDPPTTPACPNEYMRTLAVLARSAPQRIPNLAGLRNRHSTE
jgi:hypothetical protein